MTPRSRDVPRHVFTLMSFLRGVYDFLVQHLRSSNVPFLHFRT